MLEVLKMNEKTRKIFRSIDRTVDWRKSLVLSALSGMAIGSLNYEAGLGYAVISALKESAKCLATGTFDLSLCRGFARSIENRAKAYAASILIPVAISLGSTYLVHAYIKGTPHPIRSIAPSACTIPVLYTLTALRNRKVYERELRESKLASLKEI